MKYTVWNTTYTLEGNTVSFDGTKGTGSFAAFESIGNSVSDFENVCNSHFVHELALKDEL